MSASRCGRSRSASGCGASFSNKLLIEIGYITPPAPDTTGPDCGGGQQSRNTDIGRLHLSVRILIARPRFRLSQAANHQKPPTAFETDNGPSALAAGTALHAPFRPFGGATEIRAGGSKRTIRSFKVRNPYPVHG